MLAYRGKSGACVTGTCHNCDLFIVAVPSPSQTAGLHEGERQQRVGSVSTRPSDVVVQPGSGPSRLLPPANDRCRRRRLSLRRERRSRSKVDRSFAEKTATDAFGSTSAGQPTRPAVRYAALSCRSARECPVGVSQPALARADRTTGLGHERTRTSAICAAAPGPSAALNWPRPPARVLHRCTGLVARFAATELTHRS